MSMDHTPFIAAAYAVFFLVLGADAIAPVLARKRLMTGLRNRWLRQATRSAR